ncbi:DEKNAAC102289 [Brettanomyces naardenensis]|uniref:DEKNAAC102289 n=1 Tax=Brettanomyces naardenensis TaxID=13370 RepID=A0A448YL41_BRENA|nr:DEKNAAC102289 [Brettanomyces naardenensis]
MSYLDSSDSLDSFDSSDSSLTIEPADSAGHRRRDYTTMHQFMDTSFLQDACSNSFTILQAISGSDSQLFRADPPQAVDYLSSNLQGEEYFSCWKAVANNHHYPTADDVTRLMPSTSSERLENACWRAWYKSLRHLKELDPAEINWYKVNDVTCLYGPVITDDLHNLEKKINNTTTTIEESSPCSAVDISDSELADSDGTVSDREDLMSDMASLSNSVTGLSAATTVSSSASASTLKSILKKDDPLSCLKRTGQPKKTKRISFCPKVQVGLFFKD